MKWTCAALWRLMKTTSSLCFHHQYFCLRHSSSLASSNGISAAQSCVQNAALQRRRRTQSIGICEFWKKPPHQMEPTRECIVLKREENERKREDDEEWPQSMRQSTTKHNTFSALIRKKFFSLPLISSVSCLSWVCVCLCASVVPRMRINNNNNATKSILHSYAFGMHIESTSKPRRHSSEMFSVKLCFLSVYHFLRDTEECIAICNGATKPNRCQFESARHFIAPLICECIPCIQTPKTNRLQI